MKLVDGNRGKSMVVEIEGKDEVREAFAEEVMGETFQKQSENQYHKNWKKQENGHQVKSFFIIQIFNPAN